MEKKKTKLATQLFPFIKKNPFIVSITYFSQTTDMWKFFRFDWRTTGEGNERDFGNFESDRKGKWAW